MSLNHAVEDELQQASVWWRWRLFLNRSTTLASVACGAVFLLGLGMLWGWFPHPLWVAVGFGLVLLTTMTTWLVLGVVTIESRQDRRRLALALEKTHQSLMDRLNTLVFLQNQQGHPSQAYLAPIQKQTIDILTRVPSKCPFSWRGTWLQIGICAAVMAMTIFFYAYFQPWRSLLAGMETRKPEYGDLTIPEPEPWPPEDAKDPTRSQWGEIRISRPGRDLRATRLDVIPLEIEAATSDELARMQWVTAVNDQDRVPHELPPAEDLHYAVYQPEIVLDDLGVADWDVVHYFARATTRTGGECVSDVYFVDVIPPRHQLEKLPGGKDGVPYAVLQHLTAMVEQQQEVIRQTTRLSREEYQSSSDRNEHCRRLSQAEADLGATARHLGAQLVGELGADVVSGMDQYLERAASSFEESQGALDRQDTDAAQSPERSSLSHLALARRHFQQLVHQNPQAFLREPKTPGAADPAPQGLKTAQLIQEMNQQQEQIHEAREFIKKSLLAERNIQRAANPRDQDSFPRLAQTQQKLRSELEQFMEDHADVFRDTQDQADRAKSAMQRAEELLRRRQRAARQFAKDAADQLLELDQKLEHRQQTMDLSHAYRLKTLLDKQIDDLKQLAANPSSGQCPIVSAQSRAIAGKLRKLAGSLSEHEQLGTRLNQALGDPAASPLDAQADTLSQAESPEDIRAAAKTLREGLENVAQAFGDSTPVGSADEPGEPDPLAPTGQPAINRGIRQLESYARRQAGHLPTSPKDNEELKRSALDNLGEGISSTYGNNEQTRALMDRLRGDMQESDVPVDPELVRSMIEQIRELHRESLPPERPQADRARGINIDASRFPPGYQDAVQKYFEMLSEEP